MEAGAFGPRRRGPPAGTRAGSVGLSHDGSPQAAPSQPIGLPARPAGTFTPPADRCAFLRRSRTAEPADIGGGWFLSGRHPKAGMMPVRSRSVPQCATAAKRLPHRQSRPGRVWNIPFRGDMQKTPTPTSTQPFPPYSDRFSLAIILSMSSYESRSPCPSESIPGTSPLKSDRVSRSPGKSPRVPRSPGNSP